MKTYLAVIGAVLLALGAGATADGCDAGSGGAADVAQEGGSVRQVPPSSIDPLRDNDRTPVTYARANDPRSSEEINAAACQGPGGQWRCPRVKKPALFSASGATNAVTPPAWTVQNWYINPTNVALSGGGDTCAADTNTCTSATCVGGCSGPTCPSGQGACLTFGEVIQHRLGTFTPRLQQITVFHKLSAQLAATDLIFFEPYVGQGGQAQLVDTLVMLDGGADVAVGTVTPKAPDAGSPSGGQLLQVQGLPSNAAAGMFVCDVTQGNSCAMIDSMVDAGVAIMDQPFTNASYSMPATGLPAAVENNSWTTGDSVNVFTENLTNLKSWNPMGTDVTDAGVFSGGWVQFTEIAADTLTGTPNSVYPWISRGVTGVAGSKIDPRVQMSTQLGRGVAAIDIGNFHAGPVSVNAGTTGGPEFFGGTFNALTIGAGLGELAGDGIFHSVSGTSITLEDGTIFLAAPGAYLAGTLQLGSSGAPGFFKIGQGTALLYGPGGVSVKTASVFNAGLLWPNFLMTGALTLETATTGCVLNGLDAGAITCNIPLTTANLTAQKTLKNFNNGATFTDTTP